MTINWQDVSDSPSLAGAFAEPIPEHLRVERDRISALQLTEGMLSRGCALQNIVEMVRANYPSHVNLAICRVYWQ